MANERHALATSKLGANQFGRVYAVQGLPSNYVA